MRERIVASIVAGLTLAVSVSLAGQSAKSASGWTVPRTPDGHPDMQGVWANNNRRRSSGRSSSARAPR